MKSRSFSIIIIFIALSIVGCALIPQLPVKLMPSHTLPTLSVYFSMQGAAPRVVESEVTSKLEGLLSRIEGVSGIKSSSNVGSGSVTVEFDRHTDVQLARFEVSSIIRQTWSDLPSGVSYPSFSATHTERKSASPVLTYTITGPGTAGEVMRCAEEKIRHALGKTKGVNRISFNGATPMEWRLAYDSDQLRSLGLTPADIASAVSEQNATKFIGMAKDDSGEWLAVRSVVESKPGFDISGVFLTTPKGDMVRLDQLVTVQHTEAAPTSYNRINGWSFIICDIYADDDANQLELASKIKSTLDNDVLPSGYGLALTSDVTVSIKKELNKIYLRTGLTILILLLFVALVTRNLRYMLVITISLAMSLCVSVIFFWLFKIDIQLYSLAGITISINLIIDNIIVMGDHYRKIRDRSVFTSVLAATLTTIGALTIVFFLRENLRLNLQEFAEVVIINLTVSLAVALWLTPSLIEKLLPDVTPKKSRKSSQLILSFIDRGYAAYIRFGRRWRWAVLAVPVLAFGLPVFMIPKDQCPNTYNEKIRPWVDRIFGGTMRLFAENVTEGNFFNTQVSETTLHISASLPNGATLDQMNELIKKMERFLNGFPEISQYKTTISSARNASISVKFSGEAIRSQFPFYLKSEVIKKAITLGGGSWSVSGLDDQGFSNSFTENAGSYHIKLTGYNYDELESYAERFKKQLLTHTRIKDVSLSSRFLWDKNDYSEFQLDIDKEAMARQGIGVAELYNALSPEFGGNIRCGTTKEGKEQIQLVSRQKGKYDVWALMNMPFTIHNKTFKLSQFASVSQILAPQSVEKENQQYILCLQYNYIGSPTQGYKVLDKELKEFSPTLPLGYFIENASNDFIMDRKSSSSNYLLLLLVAAIVFGISAIHLNSFMQPLAIILTVPISYIGVFLAFYLTGTKFDQGGFAAFVLLTGITVNAAIYLITEYNRTGDFVLAFNAKIFPILLTVISTVLGFIPFMVGPDAPEPFWFPLALGTIGGLVISIPGILLFLPLLTKKPRKH